MIDFNSEKLISFAEAAALIPKNRLGQFCSCSTIWRHAMRGIKARGGSIVRLEFAKIGGRLVTSVEALQRFSERLTAAQTTNDAADGESGSEVETNAPRTPTKRRRASEQAVAELEKLGV